jgi:hypothetical protein
MQSLRAQAITGRDAVVDAGNNSLALYRLAVICKMHDSA